MPQNGSQKLISIQIMVPRTPSAHSPRPIFTMHFEHAVSRELLVLPHAPPAPRTDCSQVTVPISVSGHPLVQLSRPHSPKP